MRSVVAVLAVLAMGCGPELPAVCDESRVVTNGNSEPCHECGGECIPLCAAGCDTDGTVLATQAPVIDGVAMCPADDELFCGRWLD